MNESQRNKAYTELVELMTDRFDKIQENQENMKDRLDKIEKDVSIIANELQFKRDSQGNLQKISSGYSFKNLHTS